MTNSNSIFVCKSRPPRVFASYRIDYCDTSRTFDRLAYRVRIATRAECKALQLCPCIDAMDPSTKESAKGAAYKAEDIVHKSAEVLQGKVGSEFQLDRLHNISCELGSVIASDFSHPLHPSMVHWPVALLTTGFALDGLALFRNKVSPSFLVSVIPSSAANMWVHCS